MPEGSENVNIGEPIAIVVENKDDIPAFASVTKESLEGGAAPAASTPAAEATPAAQPAQPKHHRVQARTAKRVHQRLQQGRGRQLRELRRRRQPA